MAKEREGAASMERFLESVSPDVLKALSPAQLEGIARGFAGGGGGLTEEALTRALAKGTQIALEQQNARTPETIDMAVARAKAQMTPEAYANRPRLKQEIVAVISDETGSHFLADVQYSTACPEGRVITMYNYTHPVDWEKKAPANLPPVRHDGRPNRFFQDWRRREYWDRDSRRFIGRPLPAHCRLPEGTVIPEPPREPSAASLVPTITRNMFSSPTQ